MKEKIHHALFLCTGNSARSIMAEALLNHLGHGRFKAYSAGSHPSGRVNPFAIETMQKMGFAFDNLYSKSWDKFAEPGAPPIDFVLTVCDNAAAEVCPVWPGHPLTAHWGVDDPAHITDPDEARVKFHQTALLLKQRIERLVALPIEKLDASSLRKQLRAIGKS